MAVTQYSGLPFRRAARRASLLLLLGLSAAALRARPALAQPASSDGAQKTAHEHAKGSPASPSLELSREKKLSLPPITLRSQDAQRLWGPLIPTRTGDALAGFDAGISAPLYSTALMRLPLPLAWPFSTSSDNFSWKPLIVGAAVTAAGLTLGLIAILVSNSASNDGGALWKEVTRDGQDRGACNLTANRVKCDELKSELSTAGTWKGVATGSFIVSGTAAGATFVYYLIF